MCIRDRFSWLLAALHSVFRFGVLLPLGVAGLLLAWRERQRGDPSELVAVLFFVFSATVALFYVWARYRFPVVPLLVPFAGLTLVRGAQLLARRDWRALAAPGAALVVAAGIANLPLFDREVLSQTAWLNLGNIMLREERLDEAERHLARAAAVPHESADLHFHLAALRMKQERPGDAETELRTMLAIDPTDFRGHRLLAQVLRSQGRREEAMEHLRESVRLDPNRKRGGRPGAPIPEEDGP